jgi:hypothetical protein
MKFAQKDDYFALKYDKMFVLQHKGRGAGEE